MAEKAPQEVVQAIAAEVEEQELRWHPGVTPLTALSAAEQKQYLGLKVTKAEITKMEEEAVLKASEETASFEAGPAFAAPSSVDWRASGHVTAVKNQGSCGSCVSFGTCAAIEATIRIKMKEPNLAIDLSEAFCQFCGGGSCGGWGLTSGLAFAKSTGITDEACMPYQPQDMACESSRCDDWQSRLTKLNDYTGHATMEARKDAIASVGPVVAGMAVYNDFFSYSSGIYEKTSSATLAGYHCICVVGYNDAQGYWIIKNSWGPGWGENGFCKIGYGQADLLIDSSWQFYSVDPAVVPKKGNGKAKYVLVDKYFPGGARLYAYAGDQWRYRNITDTELKGVVKELFEADLVHIWWDGPLIEIARAWKNP